MRRRRIAIITACSLVVVLVAILVTRSLSGGSGNDCLNGIDYTDLTGQTMPTDTNPASNFYSYVLEYADNSLVAANEQQVAADIARFYTTHTHKSMQIELSGINQDPTTDVVATKRLESFADKLKQGGVNSADIKSSEPQFYELDSDYAGVVTATIISGQECSQ